MRGAGFKTRLLYVSVKKMKYSVEILYDAILGNFMLKNNPLKINFILRNKSFLKTSQFNA